MSQDTKLRQHLLDLLHSPHAHATLDAVVEGFPFDKTGVRPPGLPHSAWELLEHMRIAQKDIVDFSRSAESHNLKFPDDYWPPSSAPSNRAEWHESHRKFNEDLVKFETLLRDPANDLYRPFPWGDGQTLLREALLLADHNSYHIGQLMLVRRAVEASK